MALFGEKYGAVVRMVKMGDFSTELCGGTHCTSTGNIGLFKIVSESSVAAGIRRIEAVTGMGVLNLITEKDALIAQTAQELKASNAADLPKRAAQLQNELKAEKHEIDALNAKLAAAQSADIMAAAVEVNGVLVITHKTEGMNMDAVRAMVDDLRSAHENLVAVISVNDGGKLNFVAACGKAAVAKKAHAGNIVREVAKIAQGGGGGRPDFATAGAKNADKIDEALAAVLGLVEGMVK